MARARVKFYNSIRFTLSAAIAVIIFLSVAVLSVLNAQQSLERETGNYRVLVQGAASAYAASVSDAVAARDEMATLSALRGMRELPNVTQSDVVLPDGEVFVELGTGAWLVSEDHATPSIWGVDHIRVELPIVKSGSEIGRLGMLVSIAPLRREILTSLFVTMITALIVSAIGIAVAQILVSRITGPILRLSDAMTGFEGDHSEQTFDLRRRKDETGALTQSFEDMIGRIQERDAEIARHLETLEETVEECTADLRVAKEDAEAANAAKSDFLATMSHEIRTPMNGMMVMAEMLGAADLSSRHRRYAEIINRSGRSLLTIINDILDLSKIEAGQLDLELLPTSPEQLILDVASLFWERARSKQLQLATFVSPEVPETILADPTRLNQVISNLVNNALKFTEVGGVEIRINATSRDANTCDLILDVIDTGIGIPEDKIEHIFESFSQADQSTTRQFGGTGLGLTVCSRLVSAMDGTIKVASKPGAGSRFRVEFPARIVDGRPSHVTAPHRIGLNLEPGLVKSALEASLKAFGCEISHDAADFWIASSHTFQAVNAPVILLSDIGDTRADALIRRGEVCDSVSLPYLRRDIAELLQRAATGSYRGAAALDAPTGSRLNQTFEGCRVLAADDNAVNREVLREALTTLKVEAVFVEDGAEAIAAFEADTFDMVFMDGSMPVMDGFEATRKIRALEAARSGSRTPIFALTAQVAGTSDTAWAEAGADGHILKPFTLDRLADVLGRLSTKLAPSSPKPEPEIEASALDLDTIASLEKLGGGTDRVREKVWTLFETKAPDMLKQLHAVMDAEAPEDIAKSAHAFKSMALSSGLSGLADALLRIETLAAADNLECASAGHKAGVSHRLDEAIEAIEAYRAPAISANG